MPLNKEIKPNQTKPNQTKTRPNQFNKMQIKNCLKVILPRTMYFLKAWNGEGVQVEHYDIFKTILTFREISHLFKIN